MEDGEENPLGQEGYWEGVEGKQQLNEIEEMLELIEEAENLRKADQGNLDRRFLKEENHAARESILPLIQAEKDAIFLKREERNWKKKKSS
ncbi:unnamed protein product [Calypogeia fissa]